MKKLLFTLAIVLLFIPFSLASFGSDLGTFKIENSINLIQTCDNCTFNNISYIKLPNSTLLQFNEAMTKDSTFYNWTLSSTFTDLLGEYIVNGVGDLDGDNTVWSYTFEITADGFAYDQPRAFTYIFLLILLIFIFIITCVSIALLPSGNIKNEIGDLISINHLKYLTYILYPLAWFLMIAIMFTASNMGIATGIRLFGDLFFNLFNIMYRITPLLLVIWFSWILLIVFRDREFKRLLNRGIDMGGQV